MNFRSTVFTQAHHIKANTNQKFATCLAKSWDLYRLGKKMTEGNVRFGYLKKDGSLRKAVGTLYNIGTLIKGTGTSAANVFNYFDVDKQGFRSFRIENLIY